MLREQSVTDSRGVWRHDFRQLVLGRCWGPSEETGLAASLLDGAHGHAMCRGDGQAAAFKFHLVSCEGATSAMEGEMQGGSVVLGISCMTHRPSWKFLLPGSLEDIPMVRQTFRLGCSPLVWGLT